MNRKQKPRLGVVAATLLVGLQIGSITPSEAGVPNPYQLLQIQKMIRDKKVDELMSFLDKHPHLTTGPSALAQQLRDVVSGVRTGDAFSFSPRDFERAGGLNRDSVY